jgi:hypothetical protein
MNIIEYYYNDDNRMLHVEFSTNQDGDSSYRVLELILEDVMLYSPSIIHEDDTYNMDENDIIELIEQYLIDNDLYNNYDYVVMTQDTFIIKNRFDFNELHNRNVTACPLVGGIVDDEIKFGYSSQYIPLLESLGLKGKLDEMTFCWCTSFVISTSKTKQLFNYIRQITITIRDQSCASERYMARIILELNEGETHSLDCGLNDVINNYNCHTVDLFSNVTTYFAKRAQQKTERTTDL